ncbi:MAG: DUF5995 family protein [Polyangiales bacterium]
MDPTPGRGLDELIDQLAIVVERAQRVSDRLGYFAALYRQITVDIKRGITGGLFEDGARMQRFAVAFAGRFFDALDARSQPTNAPKCWQLVFALANDPEAIIVQHLLVAINAHINLDLPVATAETAPGAAIDTLANDYQRINDLLLAAVQRIQTAIGEVSPLMDLLDDIGWRGDEWLLDFSLTRARTEAWSQAVLLAQTPDAQKPTLIQTLDNSATHLGRVVAQPSGILRPALEVIRFKEERDVSRIIAHLDRSS